MSNKSDNTTKKKLIEDEDDFSGEESDLDMNEMMQQGGDNTENSTDSDSETDNEEYNEQVSDKDDLDDNDDFDYSGESSDSDEETMKSKRKKTIYDLLHDEIEDELDLGDADNYKKLEIKDIK